VGRTGRWAAHHSLGDRAVRRRIDVTRLFANSPGALLTTAQVASHTVGTTEQVYGLLEELTGQGWLRRGRNGDGQVAYRRVEARRA
jgi:hypothetical protein